MRTEWRPPTLDEVAAGKRLDAAPSKTTWCERNYRAIMLVAMALELLMLAALVYLEARR